MRYLLSGSLLIILVACNPYWKQMQPAEGDITVLRGYVPEFTSDLYNTHVDIMGNHLSGLLLIKKMPGGSTRLVFSNEMGYTFFDFEFDPSGNFKVHSVIPQLNKRSVLKTLRNDLELILMQPLDPSRLQVRKQGDELYYIFPGRKGFNVYVVSAGTKELLRMERSSDKKVIVETIMKNYINGVPDTIGISHKTFDFTIGLKRLER